MSTNTSPPSKPEHVETVLLDAGGVLIDLDYHYLARLLEARGGEVDIDALSRAESLARTELQSRVKEGERVSELWRDYFHIILANVGTPLESHEPIIETLWEAHERFGLWTSPIPGAVETVKILKEQGFRLAVVSNAEGQVERDLTLAGFDGLFETVVDSHVVGVEKPDPAIFRIALERLDTRAEGAVYLGDVPAIDIVGAHAADIAAVLLDRHDLYPDIAAPRLKSIEELPTWLRAP
jgi:putative hydrolase of the HAD superfamily